MPKEQALTNVAKLYSDTELHNIIVQISIIIHSCGEANKQQYS